MSTLQPILLLGLVLTVATSAANVAVSPSEMAEARRWATAKFEGVRPSAATEPALLVIANHGPVQKNGRGGQPMHIGDKEYTRGLYCHAPSKLIVRLPGAGAPFHGDCGRGQQR